MTASLSCKFLLFALCVWPFSFAAWKPAFRSPHEILLTTAICQRYATSFSNFSAARCRRRASAINGNNKIQKTMRIPRSNRKFAVCPEFKGQAVCVGICQPKLYQTKAGPKEMFAIKFEANIVREDGLPFLVWSAPFALTRDERSLFARFLRSWFGHELTDEWWDAFDTEQLIGREAVIEVVHAHVNGQTYANIKQIKPYRSGDPLKSSGKFDGVKDRQSNWRGGADQEGTSQKTEPPVSSGNNLSREPGTNDDDVPF
jgi:hypothetical protein